MKHETPLQLCVGLHQLYSHEALSVLTDWPCAEAHSQLASSACSVRRSPLLFTVQFQFGYLPTTQYAQWAHTAVMGTHSCNGQEKFDLGLYLGFEIQNEVYGLDLKIKFYFGMGLWV